MGQASSLYLCVARGRTGTKQRVNQGLCWGTGSFGGWCLVCCEDGRGGNGGERGGKKGWGVLPAGYTMRAPVAAVLALGGYVFEAGEWGGEF